MRALKKILQLLYAVWYWTVALPFSFLIWTPISWVAVVTLLAVDKIFGVEKKLSVKFGIIWARVILWVTMIRVKVRGAENIDPSQSYVVAVNHQSALDILALYGHLPVDFRWVMKIEIRKIPLIGSACDWMGHVFIDRSNREKAIETLNRAKEKLINGTSILFFPEGTRSKTKELLPFKKGAFRMALDLQLPILPVTLRNTGDLMPARSLTATWGTIEMIIHPPIPVKDKTIEELMETTRAYIQAGLDIEEFDAPLQYPQSPPNDTSPSTPETVNSA